MIKALLFDIDGVLIWHEKWFSTTLSPKEYYDPVAILGEYHKGEVNIACERGVADPFVEIMPYLKRMKWNFSAKDYFDRKYSFERQYIDFELLKEISQLRNRGYKIFIGSNQNRYRKEYLKKEMKIDEIFDDSYFSCDFGYVKPEEEYWANVQAKITQNFKGIEKSNILFLDDLACNVESANAFGYQTKYIRTREDVFEVICELGA